MISRTSDKSLKHQFKDLLFAAVVANSMDFVDSTDFI